MADQPFSWVPQLRAQITDLMHRYDFEDDQYFITFDDLLYAWNKEGGSGSFLPLLRRDFNFFASIDDEEFHKDWIRVVSILIWMDYDRWSGFLQRNIQSQWTLQNDATKKTRRGTSAAFRDQHLPFTTEDIRHLFQDNPDQTRAARNFLACQFAFVPIILKQDALLEYDDKRYRLPIISEGEINHTGAYGEVRKVKIAKKHYLYVPSMTNDPEPYPEEFEAARKEFDVDYDFAREHTNLQILRSLEIQHSRIMQSFTSIIIDQKYNLFFPWADLDLERFLLGNYLYENQEQSITPDALMREALELLGALQFLHESIQHKGEPVVFSHLDLKPNNILVMKDSDIVQYPLGKWKITDFGISSFEPRRSRKATLVSARELYVRSNRPGGGGNAIELERFPGPFQPPEAEKAIAEEFLQSGETCPGDRSDIWSYGCIILSVLAFAVAGPQGFGTLKEKCKGGEVCPDGELRGGRFYRRRQDNKLSIHHEVQAWFDNHTKEWVLEIWDIVSTGMLQIYPHARKSAKDIAEILKAIIEDCCPKQNVWTEPLQLHKHETPSDGSALPEHSHRSSGVRSPSSTYSAPNTDPDLPTSLSKQATQLLTQGARDEKDDIAPDQLPATPRSSDRRERYPSSIQRSRSYQTNLSDYTIDRSISDTKSSQPSEFETREFPVGAFAIGASDQLEVEQGKEELVQVSIDGSSILYRDANRVKIFLAMEEDGIAAFTSDGARRFPRNGSLKWDQAHVSGQYVALRKTTDGRGDGGRIEVQRLDSKNSHSQIHWENHVTNWQVTDMKISVCGFVAFRLWKEIALFDSRGNRLDVISKDALTNISEGVKDIAFNRTGETVIAVSSNHWLMKNLVDDSQTFTARHEFRPLEFGKFKPLIFALNGTAGFLLHDTGNAGSCVAMISDPNTKMQIREYTFQLSEHTRAMAVTPDDKALVYVTVESTSKLVRKKYTYTLRSRVIDVQGQNPVGTSDTFKHVMFTKKEMMISIATVSGPKSNVVLAALQDGTVECFELG